MRVLVSAASRHGSTEEIARAIARVLARRGHETAVVPPEGVRSLDSYDAVVLGSAVYAGHWLAPATDLVDRAADGFSGIPVWLFSSGPIGDPERKLVRQMAVDPVDLPALREKTGARGHRMFAGRLDRRDLPLAQRASLTLVRGLEGDFRDWAAIEDWGGEIAEELAEVRSAS